MVDDGNAARATCGTAGAVVVDAASTSTGGRDGASSSFVDVFWGGDVGDDDDCC